MDKRNPLFQLSVELWIPPGTVGCPYTAHLNLPAASWTLKDALEWAQITDEKAFCTVEVLRSEPGNLEQIIPMDVSLYELNHFAQRLACMDEHQFHTFEGLVLMEQKGNAFETIPLERLINLTHSLDECHVVYEAHDDESLGRFYSDNDFVPELEGLPEKIYESLDYAAIGKRMREAEHGVFASCGYVVQTGKTAQVYHSGDAVRPQKPDYALLLAVSVDYIYPGDTQPATLKLPADNSVIEEMLEHLGAASLRDCSFKVEDYIVPRMAELIEEELANCNGDTTVVEHFSARLLRMEREQTLPIYKAMLEMAPNGLSLDEAIMLSDHAAKFGLMRDLTSPADYAREEILKSDIPLKEELLACTNLSRYGEQLMRYRGLTDTPYGALYSPSGQTVAQFLQPREPRIGQGMQMQ